MKTMWRNELWGTWFAWSCKGFFGTGEEGGGVVWLGLDISGAQQGRVSTDFFWQAGTSDPPVTWAPDMGFSISPLHRNNFIQWIPVWAPSPKFIITINFICGTDLPEPLLPPLGALPPLTPNTVLAFVCTNKVWNINFASLKRIHHIYRFRVQVQ